MEINYVTEPTTYSLHRLWHLTTVNTTHKLQCRPPTTTLKTTPSFETVCPLLSFSPLLRPRTRPSAVGVVRTPVLRMLHPPRPRTRRRMPRNLLNSSTISLLRSLTISQRSCKISSIGHGERTK